MKIVFVSLFLALMSPLLALSQMPVYKGSYRELAESKKYPVTGNLATSDSLHSFDVLAYTFNLGVSNNFITGNVNIRFKAVINNLAQIDLHLVGMTVDSVRQTGLPVAFSRPTGLLRLNLISPLPTGDTTMVTIFYHGAPSSGFYFSSNRYGQPMWYTSTEPSDARYWFPCWDEPWDKAYSDMTVSGPIAMKFTGNGRLIDSWDGPGPGIRSWHWVEGYPVSTYLISLAACDYAVLRDSVLVGGSYLPLTNYVYHADSSDAVFDFGNVDAMISFYSEKFGNYPFMGEKYSMSQSRIFNGYGAMENQTNTTYGDGLIDGNRGYEWIVAHELAHMWFGDKTTCLDWRNIWLNESFATYLDALFTEHFYGASSFRSRMADNQSQYFNEDSYARYPIYNPPSSYLFGSAEYEKGAWVLHMLRRIMGDEPFFTGMAAYSNTFPYGNASTADFQGIMESFYVNSLEWFFNEWIYDQGFPVYSLGWATQPYEGRINVLLEIRQDQINAPRFEMPIDIRFQGIGYDTTVVFWNNQIDQYYSISFPIAPSNVIFDPDSWILKTQSIMAYHAKPDIRLTQTPINRTLLLGDIDTVYLPLGNAGNAQLNYSLSFDPHWLAITPVTGFVGPGLIDTLDIVVIGHLLGDTTTFLSVSTNDPNRPLITIPVNLTVTGSAIIPGDANNSGTVNGIDVIYLVNYLKGLGPAPSPLLLGDSNGSCDVNGIDVTYLVNYLKGIGNAPFAGNCR
jgi:hypothetical protein